MNEPAKASVWRWRDIWPLGLFFGVIVVIGAAGLIRAFNTGSVFAGVLGLICVGGGTWVLERLVVGIRAQGKDAGDGRSEP